jgi:hypothetical protein
MHGASISRWTMAYFASALGFLIVGMAAWGCGYGLPTEAIDAPDTLAVVHLFTIGWLGLLFCGALLQFVPVLAATHLKMAWLAGPALVFLLLGIGALTIGFLALGGHVDVDVRALAAASVLLVAGFGCLAVSLSATILSQKVFDVPSILVMVGIVALAATVAMGASFAGMLSGLFAAPRLASILPDLVPYHAASGLLGWMTLTAVGVSYRLFAMFMLAPEKGHSTRLVTSFGVCALVVLYVSFAIEVLDLPLAFLVPLIGVALAFVLLAAYGRDVWRMFRARRRKVLELNSLAGLVALVFLGAAMATLAAALLFDLDESYGVAAFYLLGMGWLSGLGLAQLYKIVPFLTWLETYGPVMGKSQVPRVQDLVDERHAKIWFAIFYLSVCVGATAIVADLDLLLRAASWSQCAAVLSLTLEYLRARRLSYAPVQLRLPPGAVRPHLIYANPTSKE